MTCEALQRPACRDFGAFPDCTHGERTALRFDAMLHARQTQAVRAGVVRAKWACLVASSIVAYGQQQLRCVALQIDVNLRSSGMLDDVIERFLHDAKDIRL